MIGHITLEELFTTIRQMTLAHFAMTGHITLEQFAMIRQITLTQFTMATSCTATKSREG